MKKTTGRTRAAALLALAIFVALASTLLAAGAVDAAPKSVSTLTQTTTCDSVYGCTPTTPQPGLNPVCTITPTAAMPGDTVTGTLSNIPVGTHARLLYDGATVDEGDAAGVGPMGSVTLSFVVPTNATGGNHTVVFVGAGFQCDPTNGTGLPVGVLDLEISRGVTTTVAGTGGGSLARTGIEVALYLALALVLLVVGFLLVQEARRRRRRAARRRNAPDHLVDR